MKTIIKQVSYILVLAFFCINTPTTRAFSIPDPKQSTYLAWKRKVDTSFTKNKASFIVKNKALLDTFDSNFTANRQLARYCYNYLRELNKLSVSLNSSAFDLAWLANIRETLWTKQWQSNKTSLSERQRFLLTQILDKAHTQAYKLCAYNVLCKLLKKPIAHTPKALDINWAKSLDYDLWKREKTSSSQWRSNSMFSRIHGVSKNVKSFLENTNQNPANTAPDTTRKLLYNYNLLRELLKLPKAAGPVHINKTWFTDASKHLQIEYFKDSYNFTEAGAAEKLMLQTALKRLGIKREIIALQHPETFGANTQGTFISFARYPDFDTALAVLYHELGHVVIGIANPQDPAIIKAKLKDPRMVRDVARVNNYLQQGLKVITKASEMGAKIITALEKQPFGWTRKEDDPLYLKQLYHVNNERRADLFMLDQLYQQNKITPIISLLNMFVGQGNTIIPHWDPHPSGIERALYMIGFLADKNIDINAELKKWEEEGVCVPKDSIITEKPKPVSLTPAAQDVEKILSPIRQQQQNQYYKKFKEDLQSDGISVNRVLYTAKLYLNNNSAFPNLHYELSALYYYNYGRELLKQPRARDISKVDLNWLDEQMALYPYTPQ